MNARPILPSRRLAALAIASLVAATALSAGLVAAATRPGIWIDQPLPGAILAFGPTPVTVHVASPGGVDRVRFLVDGLPAEEVSVSPGDLVTVAWSWTPATMGGHLLTAIAIGTDGVASVPTSVGVTFVPRDQLPPQPTEPPATPSAGPTLGPGQTATPAPTGGPTAAPTPTQISTPGPTYCATAAPVVIAPDDFIELDYPSEANPEFQWNLPSLACIDHLVLHINVPDWLGPDEDHTLANDAETFTRGRAALPWDPANTGDQSCAHYSWYVLAFNEEGDAEQSGPGSFKVCELNPDA